MNYPICAAPQRGATLVEVLITLLLVAIGLLGAAGLHLASTRYQQTSAMRSQALIQADFIIEKMRVNNSNLTLANLATAIGNPAGAYLAPNEYDAADALPADPGCGLNGQPACTPAQAAQRDLREWRQALARELPGGRGALFPVAVAGVAEPNARRIVVMWREKPELETDDDAGLGIVDREDDACPPPRTEGIRCLNLWVTP